MLAQLVQRGCGVSFFETSKLQKFMGNCFETTPLSMGLDKLSCQEPSDLSQSVNLKYFLAGRGALSFLLSLALSHVPLQGDFQTPPAAFLC